MLRCASSEIYIRDIPVDKAIHLWYIEGWGKLAHKKPPSAAFLFPHSLRQSYDSLVRLVGKQTDCPTDNTGPRA